MGGRVLGGGADGGLVAGASVGARDPCARPPPCSRAVIFIGGYYAGAPESRPTCRELAGARRLRAATTLPRCPLILQQHNTCDYTAHVYRNVNIYGCQFSVV